MSRSARGTRRAAPDPRVTGVECPTPRLYRWFLGGLDGIARRTPDGAWEVLDEERWATRLSAAEGREVAP